MNKAVMARIAGLSGFVLLGLGVLLTGVYVVRAVAVLGESDRSWLFWGVGLLLFGIILARLGVRLIAAGRDMYPRPGIDPTGTPRDRWAGGPHDARRRS